MHRQTGLRESPKMTAASDALDPRRVIADAAGPWTREEKRPAWLARAAREIGLSFSVVHSIWYGRRKRLVDREYIALSRTAVSLQERRERMVAIHAEIRAARTGECSDVAGREDQRSGDADRADVIGDREARAREAQR